MSESAGVTREESVCRFDTDPRIAITTADCEAVARGDDYTPTDLSLIKAGNHPYFAVAA